MSRKTWRRFFEKFAVALCSTCVFATDFSMFFLDATLLLRFLHFLNSKRLAWLCNATCITLHFDDLLATSATQPLTWQLAWQLFVTSYCTCQLTWQIKSLVKWNCRYNVPLFLCQVFPHFFDGTALVRVGTKSHCETAALWCADGACRSPDFAIFRFASETFGIRKNKKEHCLGFGFSKIVSLGFLSVSRESARVSNSRRSHKSYKSVFQECPSSMSQACPTRLSSNNVLHEYHTRVLRTSVLRECLPMVHQHYYKYYPILPHITSYYLWLPLITAYYLLLPLIT